MAHIFISYSKKNRAYARQLADKLLELGFDVWIDDRIDYGDDWWQTIFHAVRNAHAFVVIMTDEANASKWVQREVTLADQHNIPAFPVWLDGDFHNSANWSIYVRTQYADVHGGILPDDEFFSRLATSVPRKIVPGQEIVPAQVAAKPAPAKSPAAARRRKTGLLPTPFNWITIPAGQVTLQAGGYIPAEGQTFEIPAFSMSAYPVTNAQFARFIEANGYSNPEWWTEAGWKTRTHFNWEHPRYWNDRLFNGANYPVVGISWHETLAFCHWLSAVTNEPITLPTEQQWQHAAQGDDGRDYPWGNEWDGTRCNNSVGRDWKRNSTSVVTQFEGLGNSPFGVVDMAGNVWEWCLTNYQTGSIELDGLQERVLRGGCWLNSATNNFNVNGRDWVVPDYWSLYFGFRCARSE